MNNYRYVRIYVYLISVIFQIFHRLWQVAAAAAAAAAASRDPGSAAKAATVAATPTAAAASSALQLCSGRQCYGREQHQQ